MICEKFTGRPFPVKFFQYNGSEYCLDPCKPKILRVTPEVRQVLEYMQQSDSPAHEHIKTQGSVVTEQIAKIQGEGFFNGSLPIVKSDDHAVNRICLIVTSSCNFRCRYCYFGLWTNLSSKPRIGASKWLLFACFSKQKLLFKGSDCIFDLFWYSL